MEIYMNMYSRLSLLMIIVALPINGMRTGDTRRESIQAHRIALKQARRAAHVYARVQREQACVQREKPRVVVQHDVCEPMDLSWQTDVSDGVRYPVILRFQGRCTQRMIMATMFACLLVSTVQATDKEESYALPTMASIAASLSTGGAPAIAAMNIALSQSTLKAPSFNGILNGKLGSYADDFGRLMDEYHEYKETNPVKAQLALSGGMALASGAIGAIRGALATLPAGGVGAIPGALVGLSTGLKAEFLGTVVGEGIKQLDKFMDHKIRSWLQQNIQKPAPVFMYFDHQLTDKQSLNCVRMTGLAGIASSHFTGVINGIGHIKLALFQSPLQAVKIDIQKALQNSRHILTNEFNTPLEGAIEHGALHTVEHGLMAQGLFSGEEQVTQEQQAVFKFPVFQPSYKVTSADFMATNQRWIDQQGYEQWKTKRESLCPPIIQGVDRNNQFQGDEQARPLWQYEGAAGRAWANEQRVRRMYGF